MNRFRQIFSCKNIATLSLFALALFIALKVQHIDERVAMITRPGKKFNVSQIINQFPYNPEWDVNTPPELIEFVNMVSQQPFYWLGKGFQATAFISQDGDYVIKFFHQTRLRKVPFSEKPFEYLFSANFRAEMDNRLAHREEIFSSSKLGYEEFPEEAGILYVHLNTTRDLIKNIKLYDFTGQMHRVRGDDASFIIQKRAHYVLPVLKELMESGKIDQAKARLDQIFDLLLSVAQKGFIDSDVALMRNNNIGFVKDRAIYIDTGHITKHATINLYERMKFEFDVRMGPLHDWLKVRYPELAAYYHQRREEILASLPTDTRSANPLNGKERKAQKTRQQRINDSTS